MMTSRLVLIATFVALCTSHVSGHEVGGLTFEVPDNERFCFHEDFHSAAIYILHYKVS